MKKEYGFNDHNIKRKKPIYYIISDFDGKLIKRAVLRKGAYELIFLDVDQGEIIAEKQFKDNWGYNI